MQTNTRSTLKLFGKILEWGFFLVLIGLYLIVLSPMLPTKSIASTYIVQTGSMEPTIHTGSIAFIQPRKAEAIKKDDIIIFTAPNDPKKSILHRVFSIKQNSGAVSFETKGDNNNAPDNWTVPGASVRGVFVGSIPTIGHAAAFLKTPKGFLILFGIPALLLIALQIKRIRDGIEEEVEKRVRKKSQQSNTTNILSAISTAVLGSFIVLATSQTVHALFRSTALASSVIFSVKDFAPPPKPVNLGWKNPNVTCGGVTNSYTITADWDDVTDVGGSIHHYEYMITYPKLSGGTGTWTTTVTPSQYTGVFNQDNGVHTYKIRAWDAAGNPSEWSDPCSITYDTKGPSVSIGSGNDGPSPDNYAGNGLVPIPNTPANTGPAHGTAYGGTVPVYMTVTDPNLAGWHFRVIKEGSTIDSHPCGNSLGNPENQGYGKCGYLFTMTGSGQFTNDLVTNLDTTKLAGDGTYWLILGAIDTLNQRTAGPISTANYWHRDPRIKMVVDNTSPTISLSVTGSPTKLVSESVTNGSFESGLTGWTATNDVSVLGTETVGATTTAPDDGSGMARTGVTSGTTGNNVWVNRLMQSFPSGAKSLSFMYNFFTRDAVYDDPGFYVRINGNDVFHMSSWMINPTATPMVSTGWQRFTADISGITDPFVNLTIASGNTGDGKKQSWTYIDKVTTYFVDAPSHATYSFSGNDPTATYFYRISPETEFSPYTGPFTIPANGSHILSYYARDPAGNKSDIAATEIVTDATAPDAPTDLSVIDESPNSITLQWTAPGDDGTTGRAAGYDLRYSASPITSESDFSAATRYAPLTSPTLAGSTERMRVEALNPDTTYYFALKVLDEAPNASTMTTISGHTDPGSSANPGDIVINELIWKGTSASASDEWVELRNRTDHAIDLTGWSLTKYQTDIANTLMYAFPANTVIPAHGYLVIAEYDAAHSALKQEPNLIAGTATDNTTAFAINDANLRIRLLDPSSTVIDQAWDGTAPPVKYHEAGHNWTMERTENPGDGTEKIRWYPCIDTASTTEFFDGTGIDFGTPGAPNRSENEPAIAEFLNPVAATATATPAITLTMDTLTHEAAFTITGIRNFMDLAWQLTYLNDSSTDPKEQGVIGSGSIQDDTFMKDHIILGTCSTGGTCVYHEDIGDLNLRVTLKNADGKETVLDQGL